VAGSRCLSLSTRRTGGFSMSKVWLITEAETAGAERAEAALAAGDSVVAGARGRRAGTSVANTRAGEARQPGSSR